jgi:hypothetical protein
MNDVEFGIWMMENLELMTPLFEKLRATGKLLPETSDANIVRNSQVLVAEFKRRYPERDPEAINARKKKEGFDA